ncbi:MAG: hypothetical protein D6683_09775, partial [Actinomyces sp.]
MITSLTGRRRFEALRREGRRRRRGPIQVVYRPATDTGGDAGERTLRVAFAIPRQVGTAVTRNRIRRRIRGALSELAREKPDELAYGEYLIRVTAPLDRWSPSELRSVLA